ncbi:hypothetical protein M422DRAFT_25623 [Sphaerobolus stellatus SS14]|nr:hypothetical protein M422DRAFT_25623 [Sphaerobolus stellatus SS14]
MFGFCCLCPTFVHQSSNTNQTWTDLFRLRQFFTPFESFQHAQNPEPSSHLHQSHRHIKY